MRIEFEDGKYATGFDETGRLFFERYGEPWLAMDNARYSKFLRALVAEVGRLREFEYRVRLAAQQTSTAVFDPFQH